MLQELNLPLRMALLVLLSAMTIRYSARGLQNGLLLLLVATLLPMNHGTLFSGGLLPLMTVDRIVWPLVFLMFVLQWRRGRTKKYSLDLAECSMFTLLAVILLNMYFHGTYTGTVYVDASSKGEKLQFFAILSGFFLPFMAYFIMRRAALSEAQVKSFLTGVGLITVYLGLTGIGEAWHQSWLVFPKYILNPYEGIHFGKVRGPFVQASWDGLAMAMGLPVLFWLLFSRTDKRPWLWLVGIMSVAVSTPYVLQRAAWLSTAAALGIAVLTWPRRRSAFKVHCAIIGATPIAVLAVALFLPESLATQLADKFTEKDNIEFRYELIETSVTIIGNDLLAGVGFNKFRQEILEHGLDEGFSSHNTILTLLAELGLLGFLPYLFIFASLFFASAKAYLLLPGPRAMIGGLWGITAAYVVMALSVELRGLVYANVLLFALWGILIAKIGEEYRLLAIRHPYVMRPLNQEPVYERQENAHVS